MARFTPTTLGINPLLILQGKGTRREGHSPENRRHIVTSVTSFLTDRPYSVLMSGAPPWRPEYSVNIAELDCQHQSLFRIVQNLRHAIAAGRGHEVTEAVLDAVVNYTMHHFATEENLMQQHGFPGTATHRIEHNTLTLKISGLQNEHAAGKPDAAERFLHFLQQWLEEHMLKRDKEYVQFLSSKGVM